MGQRTSSLELELTISVDNRKVKYKYTKYEKIQYEERPKTAVGLVTQFLNRHCRDYYLRSKDFASYQLKTFSYTQGTTVIYLIFIPQLKEGVSMRLKGNGAYLRIDNKALSQYRLVLADAGDYFLMLVPIYDTLTDASL